MAKTFREMVAEAKEGSELLSPQDAQKRIKENPNTLIIDVREPSDIASTGAIPGSMNIPLGVLPIKADTELPESYREAKLQDRSTPIITTCQRGGQASLAAKTLRDMGFTNVSIMDGGTVGWKEAGLGTEAR